MNEPTTEASDLPSCRMNKPYWLEGEELRRDGVVVDGDMAWEMFCACFDGDNDKVSALLTKEPKLVNAQLWYCKPIDGALRHGHLDVVRTIHEFDREHTLAFYTDSDTYRCGKAELLRRGYTHIVKYFEEEYWPRLVPNHVPELDEIAEFFPKPWDKDKTIDRDRLFAMIGEEPGLLKGQTRDGRSLLYLALEIWKVDLASELVDRGAEPDIPTAEGKTVVDIAALRCADAIPWLLELGVEQTLIGAIASSDAEAVRSIVNADPSALYRERLSTPLALAVMQDRRDMVELLLRLGVDPNYPTENCPWGNALLEAAERNNVELMRVLLEAGVDPNPGADSSGGIYEFLTNWDRRSSDEIAPARELLLGHGADPHEFGIKERDKLEFLRTASDKELLGPRWDGTFLSQCGTPELLDAYVARFGTERIVKGPWYEMCKAPWSKELTDAMMRHGYDIDHGDWLGRTELHAAAASNELERATYLLELGANPNLLDAQHSATPLGFAAREGHLDMVKLLLEHGADKTLPIDDSFAWARPLESAEHFLANHEFRFREGTSNQGELTGRYTKSPKQQYEAVIAMLK